MKPPHFHTPMAWIAGGFIAGILIVHLGGDKSLWAFSTVVISAVLLCVFIYRREFTAAWSMAALAGGIVSAIVCTPLESEIPAYIDNRPHLFTATVLNSDAYPTLMKITAEIDSADGQEAGGFKAEIMLRDISEILSAGDVVCFTATLRSTLRDERPEGVGYPKEHYLARDIEAEGSVRAGDLHIKGQKSGLRFLPSRLRDALALKIYSLPLDRKNQQFLATTVLGLRGDADRELKDNFRLTGISHLLCISGFHVALIAAIIALLLTPMKLSYRLRTPRVAIMVMAIWAYILLTGAQPPSVRAGIMVSVFSLSKLMSRGANPFNSLATALLIILAINPYMLYDGGFLLSFSAVAGILMFARKLNPVAVRSYRLRNAVGLFTVSVAAVLGTLPATISIFHVLPLLFVPANIIAGIIFPVILVSALAGMLLYAAGMPDWVFFPERISFGVLDRITEILASHSDMMISCIYLEPEGIFLLALSITVLAIAIRMPLHKPTALGTIALAFALLFGAVNFPEKAAAEEGWICTENDRTILMASSDRQGVCIAFGNKPPKMETYSPRAYFGHRRVDSPAVLTHSGKASLSGMSYGDGLLTHPDRSRTLIIHNHYLPDAEVIGQYAPTQLLLSPQLSEKHCSRYLSLADSLGIRAVILPKSGFYRLF